MRYVPVSLSSKAHGANELSLLAVLVVFRGRLQPELLDPGLPKDAAVYPLTTPNRDVSARFFRLSAAAEARFSFGIEWCRSSAPSGDDGAALSETPVLRLLFRATSASEYARWKQVMGAALAMPVARVSVPSESFEAVGKSTRVSTGLSESFRVPASALLKLGRHTSHICDEKSCEVEPIDEASNPNDDSSLATQCSASERHGAYCTDDGASSPQCHGQSECAIDPAVNADVDTNGCEPALVPLPPALRDMDALAPRDPVVHLIDGFAVIDARRARLKHARSHESVLRPHNSFRLQFHATLAVSAQQVVPTERAYRKSSSASHVMDIDRTRLENAANGHIERRNADTTSHPDETSNASETHQRLDCATASVRVDVQAIVRHFETFSWQPDTPRSGLGTQQRDRRCHPSMWTKPQWRSVQSMPASLDTLPFNERDGFSWRVTPASCFRQQHYQSIREVNREIERRVRALMNDPTPLDDVESGCLPVLLPGLTIQPWNVPPSTRSAFEEFCCH